MILTLLLRSQHLRQFLSWAHSIPVLAQLINRFATNAIARSTTARPRPFSLWSPVKAGDGADQAQDGAPQSYGPISEYTSWPALTDRTFSARHLAPASKASIQSLPQDLPYNRETKQWGSITSLFERPSNELGEGVIRTDRSSVLFLFFAQWFTDSVLRIDPRDRRKNTSNHDVDLCQIYGLSEQEARCLRSGSKGRLRSQLIDGQEFPDYLGERDQAGAWQVKKIYRCAGDQAGHPVPGCGLHPHGNTEWMKASLQGSFAPGSLTESEFEGRLDRLYATGLERGNSSVGYVALSLIFLREHNRLCTALAQEPDCSGWDDERLFQTARMINICILLKLTVEDYINHIAGHKLFLLDHTFAEQQNWYRTNWIALEFDLLYRWHGLVPDQLTVNGSNVSANEFRWNNALLEELGVASLINNASAQPAGKIGLGNNPSFLMGSEYQTIKMGRDFRLQNYNAYREHFQLSPLKDFSELTSNTDLADRLAHLYGSIDQLELVVGLFAEEASQGALFGLLMLKMVAYDAFTQIYTNPLLSTHIHTPETLTTYGLEQIAITKTFEDLVARNLPVGSEFRATRGVSV